MTEVDFLRLTRSRAELNSFCPIVLSVLFYFVLIFSLVVSILFVYYYLFNNSLLFL
jgi:hypothetical protein